MKKNNYNISYEEILDKFPDIDDNKKMQLTNKPWNDLKLNSPWSIGNLSKLIESRKFATKEKWEEFYFESGRRRLEIISKMPDHFKYILLDPHSQEKSMFSIPEEYRYVNFEYGRTRAELNQKAFLLYGFLQNDDKVYGRIKISECVEMVRHRTLRETWNGIVVRENNTINKLISLLSIKGLDFEKANGEEDCRYAIDYKAYFRNKYIVALQVKPVSYKDDSKKYIRDIMDINKLKHKRYKEKTGIDTLYIYSDMRGNIDNMEIIDLINKLVLQELDKISA